jgi:hypothetical protein
MNSHRTASSTRSLLILAIIIYSSLVGGHSETPAQEESSGTQRAGRLRETVLRALRANDQKLGAVELYVQDVLEDLTVSKREETIFQPEKNKNTRIITVREPRRVSRSRLRLFGDNLRYEYLNSPEMLSKAFSFDGALWTELKELGQNTQVIIRRPDQMASMSPLDPRQVAVFDVRQRLSEVLDQSTFSDQPGPSGKTGLCTAETKVAVGSSRLVISFDPSVGTLPVETVAYNPDSTVARHTQISYRKIEARDAWVLDQAITHTYGIGETRDLTSPKFQQRWTKSVKNVKLLADHDDALIAIDRPSKYLLHDLTKAGGQKPVPVGYPSRRGKLN